MLKASIADWTEGLPMRPAFLQITIIHHLYTYIKLMQNIKLSTLTMLCWYLLKEHLQSFWNQLISQCKRHLEHEPWAGMDCVDFHVFPDRMRMLTNDRKPWMMFIEVHLFSIIFIICIIVLHSTCCLSLWKRNQKRTLWSQSHSIQSSPRMEAPVYSQLPCSYKYFNQ